MGGTWRISPRNAASASSSSRAATDTRRRSSTVPVTSWVSVTVPSRSTARYSFSPSAAYCTARVARPTNTGSTPVAMGSRVPPWPTRRSWRMPRSLAHTSMEVQPSGLSMMSTPPGIGMTSFLKALSVTAAVPCGWSQPGPRLLRQLGIDGLQNGRLSLVHRAAHRAS